MKIRRKFVLLGVSFLCVVGAVCCSLRLWSGADADVGVSSSPEGASWGVENVTPAPVPVSVQQYVPSYTPASGTQYDGKVFQSQAGRQQQFTAELQLQTTDESDVVVKKITDLAERFSGYSVYSNMVSVKVKVPVKNSKDFLAEVERLGTVIFREITSQDVTNEYRDLELKCKNLRALRDRFAELLKKANKVEDILKIESELARITTELEQATGLFKLLKNSVDMVVVNIKFTTVKQIDPQLIPIAWITRLGYIIFLDDVVKSDTVIKDEFAVKSTLPAGFVTCYRDKDVIKAIDGNMSVLQVKTHDDLPGATTEFYQKLITKHLKENNYKEVAHKKLALPDNRRGCLVSTSNDGSTYNAAVIFYQKTGWFRKQNKVLVIELYGKNANMEKVNINEIIKGFQF